DPAHGRGAGLAEVALRAGLPDDLAPAARAGELHERAREDEAEGGGEEEGHRSPPAAAAPCPGASAGAASPQRDAIAATRRSRPRDREPFTSTVAPGGTRSRRSAASAQEGTWRAEPFASATAAASGPMATTRSRPRVAAPSSRWRRRLTSPSSRMSPRNATRGRGDAPRTSRASAADRGFEL